MPDPDDYDNQDDFVSACISQRQDEHPEEDSDQSAAVCFSMWEDKMANHGLIFRAADDGVGGVEPPGDDESHDEFMSRCTTQGTDSASCQQIWDQKSVSTVVRKVRSDAGQQGMEFILSDATADRYDDSIVAEGWDLKNFIRNPIALFNHNSDFPIGRWEKLSVKDGALRGHLQVAPKGASARIDEIRALIDAGILRAVSVGFRPIESEPIAESKYGGMRYLKSELVETSLVSVPANPNALAVAKSLRISDSTLGMVFAKHGSLIVPKRSVYMGKEYSPQAGHRVTWGGKKFVQNYRT